MQELYDLEHKLTHPSPQDGEESSTTICSPLKWVKGPAMGGSGTHGKHTWWDGDLLMVVIHHPDGGRTPFLVHVNADEDYCNLQDDNDDDIGYEPSDVAWWAKVEDSHLPPLTEENSNILES